MTALWHHRPPLEIVVTLGPAPWHLHHISRKYCDRGRRFHDGVPLMDRLPRMRPAFIVRPERGPDCPSDPIERHRGQQFVFTEASFDIACAVTPRAAFFQNPGTQSRWRVRQPIRRRLWPRSLYGGIATPFSKKVLRT